VNHSGQPRPFESIRGLLSFQVEEFYSFDVSDSVREGGATQAPNKSSIAGRRFENSEVSSASK